MSKVTSYKTIVFDCDGVVLNSNKVKTNAFYRAALSYGEQAAQALVDYHVANGGVSRYKKFAYFLHTIAPKHAAGISGPTLEELLDAYASHVLEGLLTCDIAKGIHELRKHTPNSNWLIVSGGDQAELRHVFAERGLAEYFDGGIFGSPDTKDEILEREINNGNIQQPALFLGDSKYDYEAAKNAGLDFVFLTGWTEINRWEEWCNQYSLVSVKSIRELL